MPLQQRHKPKPVKSFPFQRRRKKEKVRGEIETRHQVPFLSEESTVSGGQRRLCGQCTAAEPETLRSDKESHRSAFSGLDEPQTPSRTSNTAAPAAAVAKRRPEEESSRNVNKIHYGFVKKKKKWAMTVELFFSLQALNKALLWTTNP